jgi:mannose-1-phosphate guanylyltransferase
LVVLEGLENYIVAEFDGVLMVCRKDSEQRVKDFVSEVKKIDPKYS